MEEKEEEQKEEKPQEEKQEEQQPEPQEKQQEEEKTAGSSSSMLVFCSPTNTNKSENLSDENEISFSNNCLNFDNNEILENIFENFWYQETQNKNLNENIFYKP